MSTTGAPTKVSDATPTVPERYVLIVDDEEICRVVMRQVLERAGHAVQEATTGEEALELARKSPPDTVLLDVVMPGLDGLEVCRRLKQDPETAAVPVILVTSLESREDRVAGIDAGADEFLVKPIDPREVGLRVRNSVQASRLYRQVQESYRRLSELEAMRDSLTYMLVHDFRSPLHSVQGFLELLQLDAGERLQAEDLELLERAMFGTRMLEGMVAAILDVGRMEANAMPINRVATDLVPLARQAISGMAAWRGYAPVRLETPEPRVESLCDPDLILRVIVNLLGNALKFSPRQEEVVVRVLQSGSTPRVEVIDHGPGLAPEDQRRVFEKFVQARAWTEGGRHSSGLGLTFCQMAVEAHSGRIGVDSTPGEGSVFWFELPAPEAPTA